MAPKRAAAASGGAGVRRGSGGPPQKPVLNQSGERWRTAASAATWCTTEVEHQPHAVSGGLLGEVRDAGIGGAVPSEGRVERLVVGGDEDVAVRGWGKWWRQADVVEAHRTDADEHPDQVATGPATNGCTW